MKDVVTKPEMSEMLAQTLIDRFKSMSALDNDDYRTLHRDTINLLRRLLSEFPEFLCEHHYEFIAAMSTQCIEMRNLVSCAYPRYMDMPDPINPGPNVDMLPEIQQRPPISPIYVKMIESMHFQPLLDSYLKIGLPVSVFPNVVSYILSNGFDASFIVPRINAIVLYVGTQAIDHIKSKDMTVSISTIAQSSWHSKFFSNLFYRLDEIGHRVLLNAICNQLTYLNCHTQYFSCLLYYFFETLHGERARRLIVSVILERVRVRPFPWGLAYTVAKLLKNPLFGFYGEEYFRIYPVL